MRALQMADHGNHPTFGSYRCISPYETMMPAVLCRVPGSSGMCAIKEYFFTKMLRLASLMFVLFFDIQYGQAKKSTDQ